MQRILTVIKMPFVVVATPCYGGLVAQSYMHSVVKLALYAAAQRIGLSLHTAHDSLITRGRNAMVADFLAIPHATHLLFVDADIGFEPEMVGRFLAYDEDVVAGLYPIKGLDWSRVAERATTPATADQLAEAGLSFVGVPLDFHGREERHGFVTGRYAGTGFMMIRRSVLERMKDAHPELAYRSAHITARTARAAPHLVDLFAPLIEPGTRTYLSEDYSFCHRWRTLGGKVWLDTTTRLTHAGSYDYAGAPQVAHGAVEYGPRAGETGSFDRSR